MYIWIWETPGGQDFGLGATWARQGNKESVHEQPGDEVDGSCHSKEGSKEVDQGEQGEQGEQGVNRVHTTYLVSCI
jgi:hypothetical protein